MVGLPELPLESEASGSDPDDPPSSSKTSPTTEAEEISETTDEEHGLISSQEETTISENVPVEHEVMTEVTEEEVQESIARGDKTEEVLNVEDIPQEIEISTVVMEPIEDEELPVSVVSEEALNPATSAGPVVLPDNHEPSAEVTVEAPEVSESPPAVEEELAEQLADLPAINVMLAPPYGEGKEGPMVAGNEIRAVTEQESEEEQDKVIPDALPVEEEASEGPGSFISGDLTVDEILLVNQDLPEPPVSHPLHPVPPTAPSPERESPFTRISGAVPPVDERSDMEMSITMEVRW